MKKIFGQIYKIDYLLFTNLNYLPGLIRFINKSTIIKLLLKFDNRIYSLTLIEILCIENMILL